VRNAAAGGARAAGRDADAGGARAVAAAKKAILALERLPTARAGVALAVQDLAAGCGRLGLVRRHPIAPVELARRLGDAAIGAGGRAPERPATQRGARRPSARARQAAARGGAAAARFARPRQLGERAEEALSERRRPRDRLQTPRARRGRARQ